eukprot:CAMPEP_0183334582 /NCGR_PEP_ID=MMETSP0164_2-20130417/3156_1 /TAXON_ID=221442 /ORGANISM="Coccolithus pelagicus ssp braarudi, Strain PLY182g" /LENGTH=57 /DNA_ID=CAMNT_0025503759 /DNA_START=41 /DNA_END=210 /DNA_ORIENTATION=+
MWLGIRAGFAHTASCGRAFIPTCAAGRGAVPVATPLKRSYCLVADAVPLGAYVSQAT